MFCTRCGHEVPEFLWTEERDHPILTSHPTTIHTREMSDSLYEVVVTTHSYVKRSMCSEVYLVVQRGSMTWCSDEHLDAIREAIKSDASVSEPLSSTAVAARELIDWIDKTRS